VRAVHALVEALAQQPLPDTMHEDLRELADPFVLAAAGSAAAVLRQMVGEVVPYDAGWPSSALNQAADKLRAMHNRNP
jgi:hypothetical protein